VVERLSEKQEVVGSKPTLGTMQNLVARGLSIRQMGREVGLAATTIRYWLQKYQLRPARRPYHRYIDEPSGACRLCKKAMAQRRRRRCESCNTRVRRFRAKLRAIELLGGACKNCGWMGLPAGFDFHHVDGEKEFGIGMVSNKSWSVIEAELKKCVLLCRNCHAIHHSKHDDELLARELSLYGKLFGM
jgi:hypothetical protein